MGLDGMELSVYFEVQAIISSKCIMTLSKIWLNHPVQQQ